MTHSARSCALFALQRWSKTGELVSDTLRKNSQTLSLPDQRFAFELASGTLRRFWTIEWYAKKLVAKALPRNASERLLLFMALYQRLFHENLPPHALIFEYVELAKKTYGTHFSSFVNAILRKSLGAPLLLPKGHSAEDLCVRYSYPPSFIHRLLLHYGQEKTTAILEAENLKNPSCRRGPWKEEEQQFSYDEAGDDELFTLQNPTQPTIFGSLAQRVTPPLRILDLCAGAGGKALMAWEIFHPTTLVANDVSSNRLQHLTEEACKYGASFSISCCDGMRFPEEEKFDLVIVDPPCSNSGVLFKCPEARHRLDERNLRSHLLLQQSLLKKSQRLLLPHGAIIYTTCSILPEENEEMVATASSSFNLIAKGPSILILPDEKKYEGGFGSVLVSNCKSS